LQELKVGSTVSCFSVQVAGRNVLCDARLMRACRRLPPRRTKRSTGKPYLANTVPLDNRCMAPQGHRTAFGRFFNVVSCKDVALGAVFITETNSLQNWTFGPFLAAMHRILIPIMFCRAKDGESYQFVTVDEFVAAFKASEVGRRQAQEVAQHIIKFGEHPKPEDDRALVRRASHSKICFCDLEAVGVTRHEARLVRRTVMDLGR
jgi:hypothetical protein